MATSQDFVNWVCSEAIVPEFLMYLLMAEGEHIRTFGEGSTHTTIYFPEVVAFHVCIPPVAEQFEVVRQIKACFGTVARLELMLGGMRDKTEVLERTMLAAAFRGELVPQDPNDEPASVLLERIRAERESPGPVKSKRGKSTSAPTQASLFKETP
jgi:type I restriction enzyme S subunit